MKNFQNLSEETFQSLNSEEMAKLFGGTEPVQNEEVDTDAGDTYVYTSDGNGGWKHDAGK